MAFTEMNCKDFINALASKDPVPGGGGAAALAGAIGMALGSMVGALTIGKKKYADVQDDILAMLSRAREIQTELLLSIEKDAEVFEPLAQAYKLPADTEKEKAAKELVMQDALLNASMVPLTIMKTCGRAIDLLRQFADKGTAIAISDAGCGAILCKAALQAASLNVFINTKAMKDRNLAGDLNAGANDLLAEFLPKADEIYAAVAARLK